jgi:ABC-type lipoprotein export system ATPase subunit
MFKIIIRGGCGKSGHKESFNIELKQGQTIAIVGPTGSGKTQLINDISYVSNGDTPSKRHVKILGSRNHNITTVSQSNSFLSDLSVEEFLRVHADIKGKSSLIKKTIEFANKLTGEAILPSKSMTELSGGQTRAWMVADALIISDSPILLLDEIENAGIDKMKVMSALKNHNKILIFVSHDPRVVLSCDRRIIMKNGEIIGVVETTEKEKVIYQKTVEMDNYLISLREHIRNGEYL